MLKKQEKLLGKEETGLIFEKLNQIKKEKKNPGSPLGFAC